MIRWAQFAFTPQAATRPEVDANAKSTAVHSAVWRFLLTCSFLILSGQVVTAQTPRPVKLVPQLGHSTNIEVAYFVSQDRFIFTNGDGVGILWDVETGHEVRRFLDCGCFLSSDASRLLRIAIRTEDIRPQKQGAWIEDADTGQRLSDSHISDNLLFLNLLSGGHLALEISDGQTDYQVRDLFSNTIISKWTAPLDLIQPTQLVSGETEQALDSWSGDGQWLATWSSKDRLKVRATQSGTLRAEADFSDLKQIALSHNGTHLATLQILEDRARVAIWKVEANRLLPMEEWDHPVPTALSHFQSTLSISPLSISPNGDQVLARIFPRNKFSWPTWHLFRIGESIGATVEAKDHPKEAIFSRSGKLFILRDNNVFTLWDTSPLQQVRTFSGLVQMPDALATSTADKMFAIAGRDTQVLLVNMENEQIRVVGEPPDQDSSQSTSEEEIVLTISSDGSITRTKPPNLEPATWDRLGRPQNLSTGKYKDTENKEDQALLEIACSSSRRYCLLREEIPAEGSAQPFGGPPLPGFKFYLSQPSGSKRLLHVDPNPFLSDMPPRGAHPFADITRPPGVEALSMFFASIQFSPDESRLLAYGNHGTALFDCESGRIIRIYSNTLFAAGLFRQPESEWTLTGNPATRTLRLFRWNEVVALFKQQHFPPPVGEEIQSVDGAWTLQLSTPETPGIIVVHHKGVRSGEISLGATFGREDPVVSVDFSRDNRLLALAREEAIWIISLIDGSILRQIEARYSGIAFTPDSKQLAVAEGNRILLIDLLDGGERGIVWTFSQHFPFRARKVMRYIDDGARLLAAMPDGITYLIDTKSSKELARLLLFRDGRWAVVDPEGRYDTSDPANLRGLYWVAEGNHVIELEQLKEYYTKGLLARILNGQYLAPLPPFASVLLPPTVEVISVDAERAEIVATDNGGGFGEVVALVNGREVPQIGAPTRFDPGQKQIRLALDLREATLLPSGENDFRVLVKNRDNTIASRLAGGTPIRAGKRPERKPRLFVLVAGVSQFPRAKQTELRELNWSAKDALDMKTAIAVASRPLFGDDVEIQVFATGTTQLPTKGNLMGYLEGLAGRVYPEDVLLLYFAGHGASTKVDGQDVYFFLTADSRGPNVGDTSIAQDAISSLELKRLLTRKDMPLKQVLILDTCAAGAFASQFAKLSSEQRTVPAEDAKVMEILKDRSGMHILMGSATDGLSYEASQFGQGLLTYSLLLGLRTMDLGESGSVDVVNWFNFAQKKVPELAREVGVTQQPVLSSPKGQPFPLGLLKDAAQRKQIPLAEARPMLLPPLVFDADDFDDLRIKPLLHARLMAISRPQARGDGFDPPRLVYVSGATDDADDLPKMVKPYVRYRVEGEDLVAEVRLRSEKRIIARTELRGSSKNRQAFAVAIVEWVERTLAGEQ